jgi:hypothetical protein
MTDQPKYATGGVIHGGHADIPPWQPHRVLDPVRAAALAAAVDLLRGAHGDFSTTSNGPDYQYKRGQWRPAEASEVVALAKEFEVYLTGTEAQP